MKQTKHTPGPWNVGQYEGDELNTAILIDGYTIASLDQGYYEDPLPQSQVDANANLIAAAPEMLEALEQLLKVADTVMKKHGSIDCSMRFNARRAIAKARGES